MQARPEIPQKDANGRWWPRNPATTEPYKDLYESALDTIALLAGQLRDADLALEREQEQHLDKCAELEKMRTLADYRQGKLERREGIADRRGAWAFSTVEHHPDTRVAQRRVS